MVHRVAITKARINLGQLVRRAHVNKEYFIVEKDGIPVAALMDADEFEDYLESCDPQVRSQIARSQRDYLAGRVQPAESLLKPRTRATRRRRRAKP